MKRLIWVGGLMALLAAVPAAWAADATGTWKGKVDFNGGAILLVFHLTVSDGAVTGTVEGMPTTPAEIHDGKADGEGITFSANTNYQGQSYKLVFHGKLAPAGDEIAFTLGTDDGSWNSQLTAERASDTENEGTREQGNKGTIGSSVVDVSGTWKGAFDYNGTNVALAIHLTNTEGAVTGTVEGMPTTPAEIHDAKLDGDSVSFWVNTEYQGTMYKLVFKGKVAAGQIVFTLGTDDGSWSTELTAVRGA
jgi:hypothetical protein